MKKIIFYLFIVLSITSCNKNKFTISGSINGCKNDTLYLEHFGLAKAGIIDSAIIKKNGKFKFKEPRPEYPDYYRLLLNNQKLIIGIDSTDKVVITGNKQNFATNFTVTGSKSTEQIRQLRISSFKIQDFIAQKDSVHLDSALEQHKKLARQIILENPRSLAAYYAIYQTINGYFFLSPDNRDDLPYWSAVATSWDTYMPKYDRTIELKKRTLDAITNKRAQEMLNAGNLLNIKTSGLIDIVLPNRLGDQTKLSSLKGKTILVDFSAYSMENAPAHTLFLRDLYNKYHNKNFDIYQVSLDANKLFWLEQTKTIPWICVRDNQAPNCVYLTTYNVTKIPTFFIINSNGDIVGRYNYDNVEKAIEENL